MSYSIKSLDKYKNILSASIYENLPSVKLFFSDGSTLSCAKDHQLMINSEESIFAEDSLNEMIISNNSQYVKVIKIEDIGLQTCYDLGVVGKTYDTNSVLSHNSTTSFTFLLHYILFNSNKTVAILANKEKIAKDILYKLKVAYMNLPNFLQQGILEWNKNSILLENGSSVVAASSSSSAIRGMAISCVDLTTSKIYLRNKKSGYVYFDYISSLIQSIYEVNEISDLFYKNDDFEVMTHDGFKNFDGFLISEKETMMLNYKRMGEENTIRCTKDHLIFNQILGRFIKAEDYIIEDKIASLLSSNPFEVTQKIIDNKICKVVDLLNVKETNSFICNKIIVHNCLFLDECISGKETITIKHEDGLEETLTISELYKKLK